MNWVTSVLLSALLCLGSLPLLGQKGPALPKDQLKLSVYGLGGGWEHRLGKSYLTTNLHFRVTFDPQVEWEWFQTELDWNPDPALVFEPRYYFLMRTQHRKGWKTDNWTGPYLGAPISLHFSDFSLRSGLHLGYQFAFGKKDTFYVRAACGPQRRRFLFLTSTRFQYDFGVGFIL
ncbi:MAG TPA: hypothetical protein DCE41_19575 [Cytophagales bacterium]|nr:hypothetical protein [Cytophagales bacterium]HAA21552.1 hypothetical protein [Cytophagales bacterium]HAP64001.1 hypothetical protein [Cytophagales bacterium]